MALIVTDALILRRSDWRDYDRMLTLLTPDYGRIDAVAYGCKRSKSPLMNAAEVFCAGEYTLKEVKGRYTLDQCRIHQNFYALREDYDKLTAGAYMLSQLLLAAQPDQGNGEIFRLALNALTHLCFSEMPVALITFAFEAHYQAALGQSPRMDGCVLCGQESILEARFDAMRGGVVCPACAETLPPISEGARRILERLPRTKFSQVEKLVGHPAWREAAALMRTFTAFRTEPQPKVWPRMDDGDV